MYYQFGREFFLILPNQISTGGTRTYAELNRQGLGTTGYVCVSPSGDVSGSLCEGLKAEIESVMYRSQHPFKGSIIRGAAIVTCYITEARTDTAMWHIMEPPGDHTCVIRGHPTQSGYGAVPGLQGFFR